MSAMNCCLCKEQLDRRKNLHPPATNCCSGLR